MLAKRRRLVLAWFELFPTPCSGSSNSYRRFGNSQGRSKRDRSVWFRYDLLCKGNATEQPHGHQGLRRLVASIDAHQGIGMNISEVCSMNLRVCRAGLWSQDLGSGESVQLTAENQSRETRQCLAQTRSSRLHFRGILHSLYTALAFSYRTDIIFSCRLPTSKP